MNNHKSKQRICENCKYGARDPYRPIKYHNHNTNTVNECVHCIYPHENFWKWLIHADNKENDKCINIRTYRDNCSNFEEKEENPIKFIDLDDDIELKPISMKIMLC